MLRHGFQRPALLGRFKALSGPDCSRVHPSSAVDIAAPSVESITEHVAGYLAQKIPTLQPFPIDTELNPTVFGLIQSFGFINIGAGQAVLVFQKFGYRFRVLE